MYEILCSDESDEDDHEIISTLESVLILIENAQLNCHEQDKNNYHNLNNISDDSRIIHTNLETIKTELKAYIHKNLSIIQETTSMQYSLQDLLF